MNEKLTEQVVVKRRLKLPRINFRKKNIIVFGVLLIFLVVLGVAAPFIGRVMRDNSGGGVELTPSFVPEAGETQSTSVYADDPEIRNIEERLEKINENFGNMNIREDDLRPPGLDFNVVF